MRSREKIEKTPINKEIGDPLVAFKEKEDKAMKEDKTYNSPWKHIDPNKLIDECREVFDLYKKGDADSLNFALNTIEAINIKIKKMKDEERDSNKRFIEWIDEKVCGARGTAMTKDELAK